MPNENEQVRFTLRMPKHWKPILTGEAGKSYRSLNAEVLAAIETAMRIKGVQLDPKS